jgi:hypothetical protein
MKILHRIIKKGNWKLSSHWPLKQTKNKNSNICKCHITAWSGRWSSHRPQIKISQVAIFPHRFLWLVEWQFISLGLKLRHKSKGLTYVVNYTRMISLYIILLLENESTWNPTGWLCPGIRPLPRCCTPKSNPMIIILVCLCSTGA